MLINSLYLKEQLIETDIEKYLKRISTLIRKNKVRKTREKTMSDYEKMNKKSSRIIQKHEGDLIELNEFNKEKRKYFKYKKVDYI